MREWTLPISYVSDFLELKHSVPQPLTVILKQIFNNKNSQ